MRYLLLIDVLLFSIAISLLCVDEWYDGKELLGTRISEHMLEGLNVEMLFSKQPVIPDLIEIYPLDNVLFLRYEEEASFLHKYPCVEILAVNGIIRYCGVGR